VSSMSCTCTRHATCRRCRARAPGMRRVVDVVHVHQACDAPLTLTVHACTSKRRVIVYSTPHAHMHRGMRRIIDAVHARTSKQRVVVDSTPHAHTHRGMRRVIDAVHAHTSRRRVVVDSTPHAHMHRKQQHTHDDDDDDVHAHTPRQRQCTHTQAGDEGHGCCIACTCPM
jgi:hypothetical protein